MTMSHAQPGTDDEVLESAPATRRLFLGLMLPRGAQADLDRYRSTWRWPERATLVPLSHLHVTLHFLGDVAVDAQAALERELEGLRLPPTPVKLLKAEMWHDGLAVAIAAVGYAAINLHEQLAGALQRIGLPVEHREWTPHVTFARRGTGGTPPVLPIAVGWTADRFSLVWSRPDRRYEVLRTW